MRNILLLIFFLSSLADSTNGQSFASAKSDTKSSSNNIQVKKIKRIYVHSSDTTGTMDFAASELVDYWLKMTGNNLPVTKISNLPQKLQAGSIYLSLSSSYPIRWDGYTIEPFSKGFTIKASMARGILYGVYQYLEACGCAFVYPEYDTWEVAPHITTAPLIRLQHTPRIEWRGITLAGISDNNSDALKKTIDWMAKNRFNYVLLSQNRTAKGEDQEDEIVQGMYFRDKLEKEVLPDLLKREFIICMSEHNTHEYLDRQVLFPQHPEWFSLTEKGREPGQICYSNKEAMNYYADRLIEYVKTRPWINEIGTWPLDGGGYCLCDSCKSFQTVYNSISDVAAKVKQSCPNVIVQHLAYKQETIASPEKDMQRNMSLLYCPDYGAFPEKEKTWIKSAKNAQGVVKFDYYTADNYRQRGMVWIRPDYMISQVDYAATHDFKGIQSIYLPISMWWKGSMNFWFQNLSMWEENVDIQARLTKYTEAYYGKQANLVKTELNRIFEMGRNKPYYQPSKNMKKEQTVVIAKECSSILENIKPLITNAENSILRTRIERIADFLNSMIRYHIYLDSRKKSDLDALTTLIKSHNSKNDGVDCPVLYFTRVLKFACPTLEEEKSSDTKSEKDAKAYEAAN